ncbi:thioredoxin domain-containing protein [Candidatus Daviesbacteria bacterium]|nr:thioredoxin domain-containing protein [Candidatus Daviesbacteria bacterium]
MSRETKILGAILIFSLVLIIGAVFLLGKSEQTPNEDSKSINIDYSKGQKIGSDSAKVKLVEFSDFQCPACQAAQPFVKQAIENKDNIQFIYRHFPLNQHVHARKAANFAEYAATEGKFWPVHDKLFETQQEWSQLADVSDYFANLGTQFGLDGAKIKEAIAKDQYAVRIDEDIAAARVYRVNSTPSFFLNGRKLNLLNFADLENLVDQELKK